MERVREVRGFEHTPEPFPYHPSSEFATQPGFWPNLDEGQMQALLQMCERWAKFENGKNSGEHVILLLLRFLRAREFNVTRAWEMLQQDMEWRVANGIEHFRGRSADDVLQCSAADVYTYFPTWLQGFDKQGRPVAYRQYGNFEIWELLKMTTMERLLDFHLWEIEQQVSLLNKQTEAAECTVETFLIVMDANHWSLRLATRDAYTYIRGMAEIDNTHFPERLGKLYVINAPSMLSFAWRIISSWIDPATRDKISILSSPAEWQAALFEDVDPSQVPQMYGGLAPDPTPEALRNFDPDAMIADYRRSQAAASDAFHSHYNDIPPEIAVPVAETNSMKSAPTERSAGGAQHDEHELLAGVMDYLWSMWGTDKANQDDAQSMCSVATNPEGYYTPRVSDDLDWRDDLALARANQTPQMVDQGVQTDPPKPQGCCTIS